MKNAVGQRGKASEDAVMGLLKAFHLRPPFDMERNYDARSAQGHSYARRCGDFTWYARGWHGALEVKETENANALPYSNFETHQVGKLLRRAAAGGVSTVLVFHTKTQLWRCVPISAFEEREGRGSWKLDSWPVYATLQETPIMRLIDAVTRGASGEQLSALCLEVGLV